MGLIELVMMVRDEAGSIAETIASARHIVDRWTVLDTGSTDGTQNIVRTWLRGIPGQLAEERFVDYGASRSRALDLAGEACTFTLMLSGDETLREGAALRRFCEARAGDVAGAYLVDTRMGGEVYGSARLARTAARWRYVGETHEVLVGTDGQGSAERVPDALIVHDVSRRSRAAVVARWERDLDILNRQLVAEPGYRRALFYRAQTLECLGRLDDAIDAYQARIDAGGWHEEVFIAMLRQARLSAIAGRPWADVERLFMQAWLFSPWRAEPFYDIALHYLDERNWDRAFVFAEAAAIIPEPRYDILFIEADVYRWKAADAMAVAAWYLGKKDVGRQAAERAVKANPGDQRLARNLSFFR
jgi:hypothetical protein